MDPNMMAGMGDFLKNPEMMKSAMDMLKNNPGMMEQMMNMGKQFSNSKKNPDNLEQTDYKCDDPVTIQGLKSDTYNNQHGIIKRYNPETTRYEIYLSDLDKTVSIKQNNFIRATVSPEELDGESTNDEEVEDHTGATSQETTESPKVDDPVGSTTNADTNE